MAKFTYYLHDGAEGSERVAEILPQLQAQGVTHLDEESLGELIGSPFYEIALECDLDVATGTVTVLSVSLQ